MKRQTAFYFMLMLAAMTIIVVAVGMIMHREEKVPDLPDLPSATERNLISINTLNEPVDSISAHTEITSAPFLPVADQPPLSKALRVETVSFAQHTFDICTVDLRQVDLRFFWRDYYGRPLRSLGNLKAWMHSEGSELLFATNAGMYTPANAPQGVYVEACIQEIPIDLRAGKGNFYLKPNGVFLIGSNGAEIIESSLYPSYSGDIFYATQSGPMVVLNGNIHPKFNRGSTSTYIRSGVGVLSKDQIVFAISNEPVNFFTFASLFRSYLDCRNALYLDGAISQMYLPALGRFDSTGNFGPMIGIIQDRDQLP